MLRTGPPYIDLKEVAINGTNLVDCRKQLLAPPGTDLLASGDATSDQRTEGDSVAGWTGSNAALSSVSDPTPYNGSYCMRILGNSGGDEIGEARQSITTVAGVRYVLRGRIWMPDDNAVQPQLKVGSAAGLADIAAFHVMELAAWNECFPTFVAESTTTYITLYGAADTESIYADDVSVKVDYPGKFLDAQAFTTVTEWTNGADFLKITPPGGIEVSLNNGGSKAFQADRTYEQAVRYFRSSGASETGFRVILHY